MKKIHIHFIGIKGVGVAPLAILAKEAGFTVTGCDIRDTFITDACLQQAGITPEVGFSQSHITGVDLVITTGAHGGFDNVEVQAAKKQGIQVMTQGEAVGYFMSGKLFGRSDLLGISVAGSHGKTTTTALIATVLKESKKDPSYIIGTGLIPSLGLPGHYGKGAHFVAEADEYATEPQYDKTPKLMWQHPQFAVFTNIELDHPDLFHTVEAIREAFLLFTRNIAPNGALIACLDDPQVVRLLKEYTGEVITYGKNPSADYVLKRITASGDKTFFWVESRGVDLGEFNLSISGEHNVLNATAALAVCFELGVPIDTIKKGLQAFVGTKRRAEYVGKLESGALLFDDYAHHPTEIKKTLRAFKDAYPRSHIVCIFQPHTYSRTKALFEDFSHAFSDAGTVILMDIYPSRRESPDPSVSSQLLVQEINKFHHALFLPKAEDVVEYINKNSFGNDTIIITMGAGDVYKISSKLKVQS